MSQSESIKDIVRVKTNQNQCQRNDNLSQKSQPESSYSNEGDAQSMSREIIITVIKSLSN